MWNPWGILWGNEGFMWIDYEFLKEALLYADPATKPLNPYAFVLTDPGKKSLQDNLVAWYPFNDNTLDESGNGNHGEMSPNLVLTTDRTGKTSSRALQFQGHTLPGTLTVKNSPSLKFTDEMSISLWVKINKRSGVNWRGEVSGDSIKMNLFAKSEIYKGTVPVRLSFDGTVAFVEYNGSNAANCGLEGKLWGTTVQYGQDLSWTFCGGSDASFPSRWSHVVFVYRRNGESELWVDGLRKMHSSLVRPDFTMTNLHDLVFGKDYPLNGELDDIRIYNKALDLSQIIALDREH